MAKKKRRRARGGFTLPMALVAPIGLQALAIGRLAMEGPVGQAKAIQCITGVYPGQGFDWNVFWGTYGPILAGGAIHWGAGKFGVNRWLGRHKIPIIRI